MDDSFTLTVTIVTTITASSLSEAYRKGGERVTAIIATDTDTPWVLDEMNAVRDEESLDEEILDEDDE